MQIYQKIKNNKIYLFSILFLFILLLFFTIFLKSNKGVFNQNQSEKDGAILNPKQKIEISNITDYDKISDDKKINIQNCLKTNFDTNNKKIKCIISKLTFDDLSKPDSDKYLGEIAQLEGRVSYHSLIDGIKFWPADKEAKKRNDYSVFWATSFINIEEFNKTKEHNWLRFTLNKFANINLDDKEVAKKINLEKQVFSVTGVFTGIDDGYFAPEQKSIIPNIEILKLYKVD